MLLLCLLLTASLAVRGQQLVQMDLKTCLQRAVENGQQVKIAAMEQERLKAARNEAIGNGTPQISAYGNFQDYLKLPTQILPGEILGMPGQLIPVQFGTNYNMTGGVQISQLVYNQTYLTSLGIARKMIEQGSLDLERNKQNVIFDVAQIYLMTLLVEKQRDYLHQNLLKLDTLVDLTQIHVDNGYLKKVDLDRIKVNQINLQTEISNVDMMITQQKNMIKYFTGLKLSDSLVLTESVFAIPGFMPDTLSLANHIELRMLDNQKELALMQMRMVRSECLPTLAVFGDFSYATQQNEFSYMFNDKGDWYNTSVVGISLKIPIFQGMTKYYKLSQARVQYKEISLIRDYTQTLIETQISNAASKLRSARQVALTQQTNVKLAGEVHEVIYQQYRQGIAPLTDLLSAESSLLTAQSSYAQAVVQMKIAELELNKTTGNLITIMK